jgi:hypothetical protein
MQENVHLLRVYYPDKSEPEELTGIIDNFNRVIKIIEINKDAQLGFKEKGIINLDFVKKVEIIEKAGCIGSEDEECYR